ncbi:DEAD/DEAH box helicase [Spirochaetia bacterium]|nr:DEAD/DEAH box helicase [Spirochaetia bacterium]
MQTNTFTDLGVSPIFIERLGEREINVPMEIQTRVIPRLTAGESLIFRSATGTGKTFAYLLPLLEKLLPGRGGTQGSGPGRSTVGPALLICAPTYELCSQIKQEADFLLRSTGIKTNLVIGSAAMGRQIDSLKKERPQVIVGNPGRLLLLAQMGKLKFRDLEFLVLDEGDRLVADELFEETKTFVKLIHEEINRETRLQTIVCSATFSAKSRERLLPLMGEAQSEEANNEEVLREQVEHWAIFSESRRKVNTLRSFIAAADPQGKKKTFKALIFTQRGRDVGTIVSQLQHHKLAALGLWGDMDKKDRKQALDDFRSGSVRLLVTSDLAARGLDIVGISHVIALDISEDKDSYIHRAGRTARAGKKGIMVTIGDEEEMYRLAKLEKKLGITVYPKELYMGKIEAPLPMEEGE